MDRLNIIKGAYLLAKVNSGAREYYLSALFDIVAKARLEIIIKVRVFAHNEKLQVIGIKRAVFVVHIVRQLQLLQHSRRAPYKIRKRIDVLVRVNYHPNLGKILRILHIRLVCHFFFHNGFHRTCHFRLKSVNGVQVISKAHTKAVHHSIIKVVLHRCIGLESSEISPGVLESSAHIHLVLVHSTCICRHRIKIIKAPTRTACKTFHLGVGLIALRS